jgi:hypothetical protein
MRRALSTPVHLKEWNEAGLSAAEIGRRAGVSRNTAARWLRREGRAPLPAPKGASRPSTSSAHRSERADAAAAGRKQFDGDPCVRGHGGRRFTSNGFCLECARLRNAARPRKGRYIPASHEARSAARAAGLLRYAGKACKRCGHAERYVSNNGCINCLRVNSRPISPAAAARQNAKSRTPEARAARVKKVRERYATDPTYRLAKRMGARVYHALRRHLKTKAGASWKALVGYSVEDLRSHLERQFVKGMSWENVRLWDVDHILPIASFGPMEPGDDAFNACWALTNLRPLWKRDNQRKGPRREHLI